MQFLDVDPATIPELSEGRRGRVSYPVLKSFMETGKYLVQLDRTGMQQSLQSLNSSLAAYIRNHDLPIKLFNRGGEIYLLRLDLNQDCSVNEEWVRKHPKSAAARSSAEARPITAGEVQRRFEEEKGKVTK